MKKIITTLLVFFCVNIFAQNLTYSEKNVSKRSPEEVCVIKNGKEECSYYKDCVIDGEKGTCGYDASFSIDWFDEVNDIAKNINRSIFDAFSDTISYGYIDELGFDNYKLAAEQFIAEYDATTEENKNNEDNISYADFYGATTVTLQNNKLLNVTVHSNYMVGGPHGVHSTDSLFFDLKTGEQLSFYELLIVEKDKFTAIAEKLFKQQYPEDSEEYTTLFFDYEGNHFELPETIYIGKDNLTLAYNTGQMGAFAGGMLDVEIPISEIKDYLNPDYFDF